MKNIEVMRHALTPTQKVINYVTKLQEPGKTCNQISRAIKVSEQFVKRVCKCLAMFKYIDNQNMFRFFAIDDMNVDANKLLETFKLTEHEHVLLCMKLEKVGLTYDELDSECKPIFKFTDIQCNEVNDCKIELIWQRRLVNDSMSVLNLVNESTEQRLFVCYDQFGTKLACCRV